MFWEKSGKNGTICSQAPFLHRRYICLNENDLTSFCFTKQKIVLSTQSAVSHM